MLLRDVFLKIVKMWVSPLVHDAIQLYYVQVSLKLLLVGTDFRRQNLTSTDARF